MTFQAEAGVAYHFWLRGKAAADSWANDSVMIQFSGSINGSGAPMYRIGPNISFAQSGPQTLRVQIKENGFSIDQIVLSAERYLTSAPGTLKNDTTILQR